MITANPALQVKGQKYTFDTQYRYNTTSYYPQLMHYIYRTTKDYVK